MVLVLKRGATKAEMAALEEKFRERSRLSKGVDTRKFCGVIKLKEDPLVIQKKMRGTRFVLVTN